MLCQQLFHAALPGAFVLPGDLLGASALATAYLPAACLPLSLCPQLCPPLQLLVPAHHICCICDCGALSFYSLGEAARLPVGAYTMPDSWLSDVWHCCFVPVAVLSSFICTGLSCYSQHIWDEETGLSKVLQAAFMCPFLYDSLLLFYRVGWVAQGKSRVPPLQGWPGYCHRLLFVLLTSILFTSHLPKCLVPGCSDCTRHSHQLFHICSVLGPPLQLEAILCDVCMHQAWLWGHLSPTGIPNTSSTAGLALVGNTAIISALTVALPKTPGGPGRPPGVPTGAGHWRDPGHRVRGWAAEPGRTQHPGSFFVVDPAVGCLAMSLSPTSSLCTPTVP
uniref:Uncharacterized protein n=1 Tax=Corvus moneduloides TaxID=1196302 RepID=A0A8C3DDH7_CORMO